MIKTPMAVYDLATLDDNAKSFTKMPNISSVKIFDNNKKLLSESTTPATKDIDKKIENGSFVDKNNHSYEIITVAVKFNKETLGTVQIVYEITESLQTIEKNKKMTFILMGIELVLSSLIAFFIGWRLTYELEYLTKTAEKMAENEDTKLPKKPSNTKEINILFDTLHLVQDKIVERKNELLQTLKILQDDIDQRNELELKLTDEKNFVSTLINNANAIIAVINSDGTMIRLNQYGEKFTGYTQDEVSSKPYFWSRFLNIDIQDKVINILENAKKGEITKTYQNTWTSRSGEEGLFEWSNALVTKSDGELDYIFTIGIDITESERQKQEFKTVFETTKDGLAILDLQSNFISFNDAYLDMTGYTREELLEQSCIGMSIPADVQKATEALSEVFVKGSITNFEKSCIQKDGSIITINMAVSLMPDKKHILISTKDVTESQRLRNDLLFAKEEAEKATKTKSEFLANMSHEIRTPLNGVIGLNTLLLKTSLTEQQNEYVTKSLKSSKALLGIINDILDYSKIEAGKLELSTHPFSLEELFHETVDLFEYSIIEKSLEAHIDYDSSIPYMLEGDSLRLTQILNNLIGNAVKFTAKGDITIHAKLIEQDNKHVRIALSVTDTGIGMDEEELTKLFHSFTQTDTSNTRKYGGTGLGLVISKQLIEMMGGEIWVESVKGEGTTFHFTLELSPSDYVRPKIDLEQFKQKQFMVVEDNEIERKMISEILESWDIRPIICSNGEEALSIADKTHIDYLLVDWRMPGMDGLDVIENLQEHHSGAFPKIVMISALMKEELVHKASERGLHPDVILHKPITPSILLEALINKEGLEASSTQNVGNEHFSFKGKILVAEDNEINQLVAKDILESLGLQIDIANNGAEAIQMCTLNSYDLILMDLQMPLIDGFEAAKNIRTFNQTIPIIALSAAVMEHDKELSQQVGMNDHIAKPIDMNELTKMLSRYLQPSQTVISKSISTQPKELLIDGINIDTLASLSLSPEKIEYILKLFANTQRDFCTKIKAVEIGSEPYKIMIHSIKGVSANIAASKLYALSIATEDAQDQDEAKQNLDALCIELKRLITIIDDYFNSKIDINAIKVSKEELHSMIDNILKKLEDNALVSQDEHDALINAISSYFSKESAQKISNSIENFDFKNAILEVSRIKEQL